MGRNGREGEEEEGGGGGRKEKKFGRVLLSPGPGPPPGSAPGAASGVRGAGGKVGCGMRQTTDW